MFSNRIWNYTDKQSELFIKEVRRTIASDMLVQGKKPSTVAKNIVGFGNPKLSRQQIQNNASTLLYTEATHIIEESSAEASQEWGLTHYIYLATLDKRTSNVCEDLDGTRHVYKDRQAGTNFAPMHPNCRSTHYDDIPNNRYDVRSSRKSGRTVQEVPHDMKYSEWIDKFKL